ncbi:MAG: hypothetical protein KF777_01455 [Planctomycetaceae bacterium]|nr:hypothetical protein [Planctomycetaceae bacterium]
MNWQVLWSVLLAWLVSLPANTHVKSALLSLVGIASTTLIDALSGAQLSAITAAVLTGAIACIANAIQKAIETTPDEPLNEDVEDENEWL